MNTIPTPASAKAQYAYTPDRKREQAIVKPPAVSAAKGPSTASSQSDHLREQAERLNGLARSILDEEASKRLVETSKEFRRQAEQLDERPDKSLGVVIPLPSSASAAIMRPNARECRPFVEIPCG
jgi:hypothetical protein